MKEPFFSIIVPVYQVEQYIKKCINSVLSQSFSNFEVILVDDGSLDCSGEICDCFAQNDSRVVVIHKDNGGLSSARNAGLELIRGKYVLFLDSDDYWIDGEFLQLLYSRISLNNSDVISYNFKKLKDNTFTKPYFFTNDTLINDDGVPFIVSQHIWIACAWNKAIKAELFRNNNLFFVNRIIAEDVDWCARLANAAESFDYFSLPAVAYRQRESSISHSISKDQVKILEHNVLTVEEIAKETCEKKRKLLLQYLSYQVAVFLFNVASLDLNSQLQYINSISELVTYLRHGFSKKERLIYLSCKLLGIRRTLYGIYFIRNCKDKR